MATEYEVDRMVVRLIGDQKSYQKMLQDVEKQTKQSADWAEQQGSRITNAFTKAFKSAQGMIASVGSSFQQAGTASMAGAAAIQAPLGKAALDFSEYGKSIKDMTVESEKAAKKAAEMKRWVLEGTQAYRDLSKIVKLNIEQSATFRLMSERTGESVEDLTKTIKTNSAEYAIWRKEAEKFGLVLSKDQVKAADDLAESWLRVKEAGKGMWSQVGSAVAKGMTEWNKIIEGTVTWITRWVEKNQKLIATISEVSFKVMVLGGALTAVGTVLTSVSALLGPIVTAVVAGAAAWLAWDTATGKFLQGSALQAWEQYGETAKKVANQVMEYGRQILAFTDKVMTGVFNAVKAGNLGLAVDILWSGAKVAWIKSLNEINRLTGEKLSGIFDNLAAGNWKSAMEAAVTEIAIIWNRLLQLIDPVFTDLMNIASKTWTDIVNSLDTAMVEVQNTFGAVAAWFEDVAQNVMSKWEGVKTYFAGLAGFISGLWESTFGKMMAVVSFFTQSIPTILGNVKDFLEGFLAGLGPGLASTITLPIKAALKAFKGVAGSAPNIDNLLEGIKAAGTVAAPGAAQAIATAESEMARAIGMNPTNVTTAQDVERTAAQGRKNDLAQRTGGRSTQADREADQRTLDMVNRMVEYKKQIDELEVRRAELEAKGKTDAAERLRIEQEKLETSLKQAEAEAKKNDAERANGRRAEEEAIRLAELNEEATQRITRQEQYKEQYDPVFKYMKDLKQLNAAFKESERSAKVYQLALKELKQELVQRSLALEINVSMTGLDSVTYGSALFQEAARNAANSTKLMRIEKEKLDEVDKRQRQLDKEAAVADKAARSEQEGIEGAAREEANKARSAAGRGVDPLQSLKDKANAAANRARDPLQAIKDQARAAAERGMAARDMAKIYEEAGLPGPLNQAEIDEAKKTIEDAQKKVEEVRKPKPESTVSNQTGQNRMLEELKQIASSTKKMADKPTLQTEAMEIVA